ncbi:MAG: Membrane protein involved in the export of O-antigen and teichoic acid [Microgenomates group bacterium Gr01-1014_16]|nr:MAG: Membrane protein involved in the export of O-antigen and teichoic acid [Microgenomates group bacterium Gr01-1014_16]
MGYFKSAIRGVSWTLALRFFIRGFTIVRTIILARILLPAQFGAYAVATITLAILELLTETGINVFLIQEQDNVDKYLNTAWFVSILRGFLVGLLILIFSPLISNFFHSPDSQILLILIAGVAIIRGFVNPAIVKFQKELKFNKEFAFRGTLLAIEAIVAITLAFILRSPISLAVSLLASAAFEVILSQSLIRPRPKFAFHKPQFLEVINRGKWVTAAGIFNYLYQNLDNIVVGRLLGVGSLGLYDTSYKIASVPVTEFSDALSRVSFPVYSKIRDDKPRLFRAFIKTTLGLSALVIPFGLFLFFFPQIIILLLGPNWTPAVPVLRLLSVLGVIRAISGSSSSLFLAANKANYLFLVTLAGISGLAVTIVPLVSKYGLIGASSSAIFGSLLTLPLFFYYIHSIFKK